MGRLSKDTVAAVAKVDRAPLRRVGEFEALYRAYVAVVTAYFARRARDPQTVADLAAETFVEAVASFRTVPPRAGAERAWVFAIARRVYANTASRTRAASRPPDALAAVVN